MAAVGLAVVGLTELDGGVVSNVSSTASNSSATELWPVDDGEVGVGEAEAERGEEAAAEGERDGGSGAEEDPFI